MSETYRFYDATKPPHRNNLHAWYYIGVPIAWFKQEPGQPGMFEHDRSLRSIMAQHCFHCGDMAEAHVGFGKKKQCLFMPTKFKCLPDLENLLEYSDCTPRQYDNSFNHKIPYLAYRITRYWVDQNREIFDRLLDLGPVQPT